MLSKTQLLYFSNKSEFSRCNLNNSYKIVQMQYHHYSWKVMFRVTVFLVKVIVNY